MSKIFGGNFFEDFTLGQILSHPTPRTLGDADAALYLALTGNRFPVASADPFAQSLGYGGRPLDDMLVFHTVFGKTVPDISQNAVANLGYAEGRFGVPVYPGDTITADSEVIGLRQNSNGKSGTVYVRTTGRNQREETVLEYVRWVMVRKRNPDSPAPDAKVPDLSDHVALDSLDAPAGVTASNYDSAAAGSEYTWDNYAAGEKIDHIFGVTVESAEHMAATRLYQNTANAHFDRYSAKETRFGRRLVYGGHVISIARTLSFNGLANGFRIAAINGGRHVAPIFAGDTVYAWTEVVDKQPLRGREDIGALRLRTIATRDQPCANFPAMSGDSGYDPSVVLDFDYTVLMPRQFAA